MDVVLVQAGVVAVALELDLELHLGRSHRQVADRAWCADARTTPRAVWGAARELAALNHRARLLAKSLFFHLAVPRMFEQKAEPNATGIVRETRGRRIQSIGALSIGTPGTKDLGTSTTGSSSCASPPAPSSETTRRRAGGRARPAPAPSRGPSAPGPNRPSRCRARGAPAPS